MENSNKAIVFDSRIESKGLHSFVNIEVDNALLKKNICGVENESSNQSHSAMDKGDIKTCELLTFWNQKKTNMCIICESTFEKDISYEEIKWFGL